MAELNQERIAKLAVTAFAEHVCELRSTSGELWWWRCQKPGSWIHGFDVFAVPGRLIVSGDLGELILQRTEDMPAWFRGCKSDPQYVAGKVVQAIETREYSQEVVQRQLREILTWDNEYSPEEKASLEELLDAPPDNEFDLVAQISEIDPYLEPAYRDFNPNFCWCYEALKWWDEHRDSALVRRAAYIPKEQPNA